MKIVKAITDVKVSDQLTRDWALGDDGELYYRYRSIDEWSRYNEYVSSTPHLTIREMKTIVEAFDHLMVFL